MRILRSLLLVLVTMLLLSGCQAKGDVGLSVEANGTGSVRIAVKLDAEAANSVGNLKARLRASDLKQAGWNVDVSDRRDDGSINVVIEHGFDSPEQATSLLIGLGGPFENLRLDQSRSFTKSTTSFSGTVNLTNGIDVFGNQALARRYGFPLGFDSKEMQTALSLDPQNAFPLTFTLKLPGEVNERSPATDDSGTWKLAYGKATALSASSSGAAMGPLVNLGIAACLLFAALLTAKLWKSSKRRAQHRKGGGGIRARDLLKGDQPAKDDFESKIVFTSAGAAATADVVAIHRTDEDGWRILFIERAFEPYAGDLAFPGGFVDKTDRSSGHAGARELQEETGLRVAPPVADEDGKRPTYLHVNRLMWLGVYDKPGRDPRRATSTTAYIAVIEGDAHVEGGDDAAVATWVPLQPMLRRFTRIQPSEKILAFDHDDMFRDAIDVLRELGVIPTP